MRENRVQHISKFQDRRPYASNYKVLLIFGVMLLALVGCAKAEKGDGSILGGTEVIEEELATGDAEGNIVEDGVEASTGELTGEKVPKVLATRQMNFGIMNTEGNYITSAKITLPETLYITNFRYVDAAGKINILKPGSDLSDYQYSDSSMPCSVSAVTAERDLNITYQLYATSKDKNAYLDSLLTESKDLYTSTAAKDLAIDGVNWATRVAYSEDIGFDAHAVKELGPQFYLQMDISSRGQAAMGLDSQYIYSVLSEWAGKVEK